MPRKKPGTTPGHPTDIKIGICRGIGMSREDVAALVGCSVPTVDLRKTEAAAIEWEAWMKRVAGTFVASTKTQFEAQMARRLGTAGEIYERAMKSDDIDVAIKGADRVTDRVLGKSTQKVESTSEITEKHIFELPATTLEAIQALAGPKKIESAVIDVEIVPNEGD